MSSSFPSQSLLSFSVSDVEASTTTTVEAETNKRALPVDENEENPEEDHVAKRARSLEERDVVPESEAQPLRKIPFEYVPGVLGPSTSESKGKFVAEIGTVSWRLKNKTIVEALRFAAPTGKNGALEPVVFTTPPAPLAVANSSSFDGKYPPNDFGNSETFVALKLGPLDPEYLEAAIFRIGGNKVTFTKESSGKEKESVLNKNKVYAAKMFEGIQKKFLEYVDKNGVPSELLPRYNALTEIVNQLTVENNFQGSQEKYDAFVKSQKKKALLTILGNPFKPFDPNDDSDVKKEVDLTQPHTGFTLAALKELYRKPEAFFAELKAANDSEKNEVAGRYGTTTREKLREWLLKHPKLAPALKKRDPIAFLMECYPIPGAETENDWLDSLVQNRYVPVLVNGFTPTFPTIFRIDGRTRVNIHPLMPKICHIFYYGIGFGEPGLGTYSLRRNDIVVKRFTLKPSISYANDPHKGMFRVAAVLKSITLIRPAVLVYGESNSANVGIDYSGGVENQAYDNIFE